MWFWGKKDFLVVKQQTLWTVVDSAGSAGSLLKDGNQNGLGINSEFITSKMKNLFQNQMPKKWFLVLRICNHLSPSWWLISDIMRGPLGQKWISPFSVTHDTTGGVHTPRPCPIIIMRSPLHYNAPLSWGVLPGKTQEEFQLSSSALIRLILQCAN